MGVSSTGCAPRKEAESAAPAGRRLVHEAPDVRQREAVADDGDPDRSDSADDGLDVLHLLVSHRSVQQDVVPEPRIEVLDSGELQVVLLHRGAKPGELALAPERVSRMPPAIERRSREQRLVVGQVSDDVRRACLPSELEVVAREHWTVQAETDLHPGSLSSARNDPSTCEGRNAMPPDPRRREASPSTLPWPTIDYSQHICS